MVGGRVLAEKKAKPTGLEKIQVSATRPGLVKIQLISAEIILSPRHPGGSRKDSTQTEQFPLTFEH